MRIEEAVLTPARQRARPRFTEFWRVCPGPSGPVLPGDKHLDFLEAAPARPLLPMRKIVIERIFLSSLVS